MPLCKAVFMPLCKAVFMPLCKAVFMPLCKAVFMPLSKPTKLHGNERALLRTIIYQLTTSHKTSIAGKAMYVKLNSCPYAMSKEFFFIPDYPSYQAKP
jgi:hypothetical protein